MSSKKIQFTSYGQAVDGTQQCSAVESMTKNLVEGKNDETTIKFPLQGWATPRAASFRLTTENLLIQLPFPIYKINKVLVTLPTTTGCADSFAERDRISDYKNSAGEKVNENIDITKYIVSSDEWAALEISPEISEDHKQYQYGIYKDNTFPYTEGQDYIRIAADIYEVGNFVAVEDGGFLDLVFPGTDTTPLYERVLFSAIYQKTKDGSYKDSDGNVFKVKEGEYLYDADESENEVNPAKWLFQIEYEPLPFDTKLRARKAEKTNVEYIQPFNQRAEYNAVSAFGKNMYLTAQKTGVSAICVVKNYRRLAEVPPLGSLVRYKGKKYRLVVNSYHWTNTVQVQVTHTLSENWTCKSNFVSVDKKYRNYDIPQDLLWRNLYFEDYVVINKNTPAYTAEKYGKTDGSSKFPARAISTVFYPTQSYPIRAFTWLKDGSKHHGISLPIMVYGTANSLVFSCAFKDNVTAGLKDGQWGNCSDAFYCNEDGTLTHATVILSTGCANYRVENMGMENERLIKIGETADWDYLSADLNAIIRARWLYPSVGYLTDDGYTYDYLINYPEGEVYTNTFWIDKKPGEALRFTYQIHFTPNDPDIVIGEALTRKHYAVAKEKGKRWLTFHKVRVREGDEFVADEDNYEGLEYLSDGSVYSLASGRHNNGTEYFTITLGSEALSAIKAYQPVSWAITDGKNILIACNDITCTTLVFEMRHKR